MTARQRFAANLKALRVYHRYSQETMAVAIGVKRGTVSSYELGTSEPDLETLDAIQERFNIGIDVLLGHKLDALNAYDLQLTLKSNPPRIGSITVEL